MKRLFTLLMVVLSVLLWNCSGNEDKDIDNPDKGGNEKPENVTLDLSVTDLTFEATGGTKEFIVRSNTDWAIANTSSWCQISTDKGRTDEAVTVSVSAYTGMEDRNTNLTVKSGNVTKILSVTQKRKDAIVLSKDKFDVPQAGGNIDIEVKSNIQYEVTIPEEYKDWIKEAVKSKAVETKNFSFTISANEDYSKRDGFIVFEGNAVKDTVRIYQAQIDKLILTKDQCNISSSEQNVEVELRTNVDFVVTIPDSVSGWINLIQTRAIRTDKVNLSIEENEGYDSRNAVIIFKDKNSELSDTLRIRQAQKNAIILGQKKYDLPQVGGNITVEVQSNIQYQVTIPTKFQSWLKQSIKSKALETKDFSFIISSNEEVEPREGYVIFEGNSIKDTVKIYQEADTRKLILSNKSYLIPAEGKKVAIQLRTNIDYDVIIPDSVSGWISNLQTRAMRTEYVTLSIGENEEYVSRNAVIIFKDKNSELSDTLKINQSQRDVIIIKQKKYDLLPEGGNITIHIQSNQNYFPSIPDEFKGWIKEIVKSRALDSRDFNFTISANENFGKREGYIVFESTSMKDTVRIYQTASDKLVYSEPIINVDEKGGVFNVLLESNIDYRFEFVSDPFLNEWVSHTTEIIRETDTSKVVRLTIDVTPNLLFRDRKASIYAVANGLRQELLIKQAFGEYTYKGDITFYNETDIQNFVSQGYIKVDGNVTIAEGVTSLNAFNNTLQSMSGKLSIESSSLTNLKGISSLSSVRGDLYITASHLQSFEGLSGLKEIGGDLRLNSMNELTSFKGMSKLMIVKGIYVENCSLIPSFEGLEDFIDYNNKNFYPYQNYLEEIYVTNCPAFKSFKGLEKLQKLKGLNISMCHAFKSFKGLEKLQKLESLIISMCWAFESFKELSNLTELGSLGCFHNFALTNFDGLNHITNLIGKWGGLAIHGCTGLVSLKGLEGLTQVGYVSLMMCNGLRSFEGLENLESVKEKISITQCRELYDFTFWESILMNFDGQFITEENGYNPTKEDILSGQGKPSNY